MKFPKKIQKVGSNSNNVESLASRCEPTEASDNFLSNGDGIKTEPVELCEVVSVKDEPADCQEFAGEELADPLGSSVEDILGIQDEDYLIENFVEYDEEYQNNLEIDESLIEENLDNLDPPLVQRTHKTIAETKYECNVGRRIINTANKGYTCTVCKKRYFEKNMLDEHLKTAHRTPRPYTCKICEKSFTHRNYVNLHMRVHTGEKPYQCSLCSRSYSHKTSFTIHMRIHNGERPYQCGVCGKKCYDKSGLTSHMRSHTKETPYQCECCGRRFTHSKSLLVHRRNHTGEKPYICPHCGRAFRHWHKHKIHIRLHTGERPYKCQICNKGFPRNDEVKRHMKSHTGIKSFKCSICGVYCATQASITGHINLHHVNLTTDKKFLPNKTIVEDSQSGILGTSNSLTGRSTIRHVDVSSYDEMPSPAEAASLSQKLAGLTNAASTSVNLQTIVSPRPMTPQEKVNNKSMTYRQFLNDQEQQLLAKGLKVVNKNNNTYGLAPVSPGVSTATNTATTTAKSLIKIEKAGVENAFVRVQNSRKAVPSPMKTPTRIILPNYLGGSKNPLVLGEAATNLLLRTVDNNEVRQDPPPVQMFEHQQVFIQTLNTSVGGISAPVVMQQQGQQQFLLQTANMMPQTSTVAPPTTTTSILQAALTSNKSLIQTSSSNSTIAVNTNPVMPDNGNIIVLNKGVASNPVMIQQPHVQQQQQQLLLLPGINGGPARLILLQPSNQQQSLIKLEPVDSNVRLPVALQTPTPAANPSPVVQVKQEMVERPMVQLHLPLPPPHTDNNNANVSVKTEPDDV